MVPKITPKSKKLCISNPEMQENLIVFFVIDSGRMLVERNYAICQAAKNAKNARNAKSAKSIECFRDCPEQKGGGDPPPGGFQ